MAFGQAVFRSAYIRRNVARSCWGKDSSDEELHQFVYAQTLSHCIKYNKSPPVPIVAVFTKYDMLVESLWPQDEEDLYGDIVKEIEDLDNGVDHDMSLNKRTSTSQIDPDLFSLAEDELCAKITPFEEMLGVVPWVKVSGQVILAFIPSARLNWLIFENSKT